MQSSEACVGGQHLWSVKENARYVQALQAVVVPQIGVRRLCRLCGAEVQHQACAIPARVVCEAQRCEAGWQRVQVACPMHEVGVHVQLL